MPKLVKYCLFGQQSFINSRLNKDDRQSKNRVMTMFNLVMIYNSDI